MNLNHRFNRGGLKAAISAAVIAVSIILSPSGPAQAAKYKDLKLGAWSGGIYTNNQTGEFSHCVVSAKYKSGITLLFSIAKGLKWQIGFSKPGWELTVGRKYPVLYQVDKSKTHNGQANAVTKKLAVIYLPGSNTLFREMRRGKILRVKAGNDILAFNLTGTSQMLKQLLACADQNNNLRVAPSASAPTKGSDDKNPFESAEQPAPSQPDPGASDRSADMAAQFRREAQAWFNDRLASAVETYTIVPNTGSAQKMYQKHALVWRVGTKTGIIGTLRIYPTRQSDSLENNVLAYEARSCKGDFASKYFQHDGVGTAPANRLLATCQQTDNKTWVTYYAITKRNEGGSYLVTLLSNTATPTDVANAGERLTGSIQTSATANPVEQPLADDLPVRGEEAGKVKEF